MGGGCQRLLVAGDRSHCGKSTISLGILASLLDAGYSPKDIAYIKPSTQCVAATLTARFCESNGVDYVHIGPVVFYRGFTRQFLDGEHGTSDDLVGKCARAVDKVSAGKRFVVIDGVGYPSVGSIVGCSSADIAVRCGARVLIVGKQGVGDAVDSFNLCAAYFESRGIPVVGAIFNKLATKGAPIRARPCEPVALLHPLTEVCPRPSLAGLYSIDKCSVYIKRYFARNRPHQGVYGLIPAQDGLASLAPEETCGFTFKHPDPEGLVLRVEGMSEDERAAVDLVRELFQTHVDIRSIIDDVKAREVDSNIVTGVHALRALAARPLSALRAPGSTIAALVGLTWNLSMLILGRSVAFIRSRLASQERTLHSTLRQTS